MPLYKNEKFHKKQPPKDLDPNEEVFFCSTTYEIFRDYDEFFDRTILVNSVVWSCDVCGRGDLTYQEAVDCAISDRKQLDQYSNGLFRALLWLLRKTRQSNIKTLSEDIVSFTRDRFFIEEKVEFFTQGQKIYAEGFIKRVVNAGKSDTSKPGASKPSSSKTNGIIDLTESDDARSLTSNEDETGYPCLPVAELPDPLAGYYLVKEQKSGSNFFVPALNIRRSKSLVNKEALKFFIRQTCEIKKDFYTVKKDFADKYRLDRLKWTDIFGGPMPLFQQKNKTNNATTSTAKKNQSTKSGSTLKKSSSSSSMNGLDSSIEAVVQGAGRSLIKEDRASYSSADDMMRAHERIILEQRAAEANKREEEKLARNRERELKREEKRQRFLLEREWLNPRDDLDLLDLKPLPNFVPVETSIPNDQFGDALMLLEFLHRFSSVFDLTSNLPSDTVSLDDLQKALAVRNPNGIFTDILFAFLTSLQVIAEQESEVLRSMTTSTNEFELASPIKLNPATATTSSTNSSQNPHSQSKAGSSPQPPTSNNNHHLLRLCHNGRRLARLVLGESERELDLDSLTVTEVLRIFLLSSADNALHSNWAKRSPTAKLGLDEPTLAFIRTYPDIMEKLETDNVFDLTVGEKLRILVCLMEQLLVSLSAKDAIDTSFESLKQLKAEMRQLTFDLIKAERDLAALKWNGKTKFKPKIDINGHTSVDPDPPIVTFTMPNTNSVIILAPGITESDYMKAYHNFNKLKESSAAKEAELLRSVFEATGGCQLMSLGQDRLYRRYWIVNSMSGLFIEDSQRELLPQFNSQSSSTALRVRYKQATSDEIELFDSLAIEELRRVVRPERIDYRNIMSPQMISHLACPAVDQVEQVRVSQVTWSFYQPSQLSDSSKIVEKETVLNELLESLNLRGFRESALHKSIMELRDLVEEKVSKTDVSLLTCSKVGNAQLAETQTKYRTKRTLRPYQSANNWLEVTFRESMLDLEARLYHGNLGTVKTENREAWRENIAFKMVHRQDLLPDEDEQSDAQNAKVGSDEERLRNTKTVAELSNALIQVAEGINSKYIVAPLGEDDEQTKQAKLMAAARAKAERELEKDEENEDNETRLAREEAIGKGQSTWERWCHVTRRARSVSQLLLHLSSLERSVRWAKSILKTYCRSCRRKGDDNLLLLCDSCDAGYHTYCLKPPLSEIPEGDWFCNRCRPVKPLPPKITKKQSVDESSSSGEEQKDDKDDSEGDDEEEKEDDSDESEEETEDSKSDTESDENETEKENHVADDKRKRRRGQITLTNRKPTAVNNNSKKNRPSSSMAKSNARRNSKSQPSRTVQRTQRNSLPAAQTQSNLAVNSDSRSSLGSQKEKKFVSKKRSNPDAVAFRNCEILVSELYECDDIWPFLEPVTKRDAPDYTDVISHPMDMRTIKVKINKFHYNNAGEILADLKLMLSNCELYNKPSSDEYKCSQRLRRVLEQKIKRLDLSDVAKSSGTFESPPRKRTRTK